jgi:TonB family protein
MEAVAFYLLKSVIWLAGFALVFILFLRNERFFHLNRIFLVAGILTSFFFPLVSIHYTVVLPMITSVQSDETVISGIQKAGTTIIPDLKFILSVLYVTGVLFVFTLIIRQGRSVLLTIKKSEVSTFSPVKLIRTTDYTSAFSFFSYVFVNPSVTDLETKEIMNHELVHIRQKHWVDLVLVELLCMMQWFNPLVWIYVRFIRQNHEYLADEVALQRTSDPAIYRAALLNQIVGSPVVSLANSFNYSLNKKRFNMMKNIISSPYRKMKILLILPVFAIVLYSFAKPDYKYINADENLGTNPAVSTQTQKEVKGIIVKGDGTPLDGANITVRGTTIGTISDSKGHFKLVNLSETDELVVSFVGFRSKVIKPVFTSAMTIKMVRDTIPVSHSGNGSMPPPPPPPPPASTTPKGSIDAPAPLPGVPPPPTPYTVKSDKIRQDGPSPLYVVDGVIMTAEEADKITPDKIESVNVLKMAADKYGEKGKNGAIEITTKEKAAKMLVIIDGVVYDKDGGSKINMNELKSMNVLTEKQAIEKYGEKGKYGAIEVTNFQVGEKRPVIKTDSKTGVMYDVVDKNEAPFVVVEEMPQFPGGRDAMKAWIVKNINYPQEAANKKIQGQINVSFVVTSNGKVKNVKVIKSLYPQLDIEASRIVSNMPDWKPGIQAGKPVDVQMQVPVEFKLW